MARYKFIYLFIEQHVLCAHSPMHLAESAAPQQTNCGLFVVKWQNVIEATA